MKPDFRLGVLAVLALGLAGGAQRPAAAERQPRMEAALSRLDDARDFLHDADPNKGGHRAKARELLEIAIDETWQGIRYDNEHWHPGELREDYLRKRTDRHFQRYHGAHEDQPLMEAGLKELKRAERELHDATPDKGGHRAKAIEIVRQAEDEVRQGIEYYRNHH